MIIFHGPGVGLGSAPWFSLGVPPGCNQTVAGAGITRGLPDSQTRPQTRKTPAAGTPGAGLPVFTWSLRVVPPVW